MNKNTPLALPTGCFVYYGSFQNYVCFIEEK